MLRVLTEDTTHLRYNASNEKQKTCLSINFKTIVQVSSRREKNVYDCKNLRINLDTLYSHSNYDMNW